MLFNSYEFIFLFLPITFFVYFLLNRRKLVTLSKTWLVLASLCFYGWWNVKYLPLITGSILFNFAIGVLLGRTMSGSAKGVLGAMARHRKMVFIAGIAGNIALLGYFKYADFFIENVNFMSGSTMSLLHIVLPLGISFFTFTQIAFIADSYKGAVKEYDLLNYFLFVTFFPHLLAGPIIHHKEMMPQFDNLRNKVFNARNVACGLFLFVIGLFKKVAIADELAIWANSGYDVATSLTILEAWVAAFSYTLQIYFDFSGYTDMALGTALLFNIKLPINFDSPYKSLSISEFWRRWHVTLGRFLRDYIYIPLGGSKLGNSRAFVNLLIVLLAGGIWHGAGWNYIVWSMFYGVAMFSEILWKKQPYRMPKAAAWFLTFNFQTVAMVLFRSKSWKDVGKMYKAMFGFGEIRLPEFLSGKLAFLTQRGIGFGDDLKAIHGEKHTLWMILACILLVVLAKNSNEMMERFKPNWKSVIFIALLATYVIFDLNKVTQFIYFQF